MTDAALEECVALERMRDHWNRELVWRQPHLGRAEFVLRRGPLTFAEMTGPQGARAEATVKVFDREFVVQRGGFWSTRVTVEDPRRKERLANVERTGMGVHDVEMLVSGRRYRIRGGWGGRRVEASDGRSLIELMPKWRLFRLEADMKAVEAAAALDEFPLLVVLQWYIHVASARAVTPVTGGA